MPRAALLAVLVLAACVAPSGTPRPGCGSAWASAEVVAADPAGAAEEPLTIDCISALTERRVRIGFTLPAGPSCSHLARIELVESADAASITLFGRRSDGTAGCLTGESQATTELDLQAPIDGRDFLDGSE